MSLKIRHNSNVTSLCSTHVCVACMRGMHTMEEPMMEAPVVVEETQGSSSGILLPLLLLVVVGAAVAS